MFCKAFQKGGAFSNLSKLIRSSGSLFRFLHFLINFFNFLSDKDSVSVFDSHEPLAGA